MDTGIATTPNCHLRAIQVVPQISTVKQIQGKVHSGLHRLSHSVALNRAALLAQFLRFSSGGGLTAPTSRSRMQGVGENTMSDLESLQVFQALNRSPNARLEACAELGDGLSAALWSNHHDSQDYQAPSHHTLSCYIGGGTGTFRRDQPGTKGGPDKLCILPAEHQSAWVINGEIRLATVYFSPEQFALGCVTLLDREPRALELRESTFLQDDSQARRFHQLIALNWQEPAERLLTSSLAHEMLSHTLLSQVGAREGLRLKGGLAAYQRRLLVD